MPTVEHRHRPPSPPNPERTASPISTPGDPPSPSTSLYLILDALLASTLPTLSPFPPAPVSFWAPFTSASPHGPSRSTLAEPSSLPLLRVETNQDQNALRVRRYVEAFKGSDKEEGQECLSEKQPSVVESGTLARASPGSSQHTDLSWG